jgi:hypothetical protein
MSACGSPDALPLGKKNQSSMSIVVYAGPTGGHVFPAQSFSEGFRKRFPDSRIDLVTCERAKPLVEKMPQGIFRRFLSPGIWFSNRLFHKIPEAVLSFSLPPCSGALFFKRGQAGSLCRVWKLCFLSRNVDGALAGDPDPYSRTEQGPGEGDALARAAYGCCGRKF